MFFLKAGNIKFKKNCEQFPVTMSILDKYPEIVSAYFSVLGANKALMPHCGPWSGVLRMHMECTFLKKARDVFWYVTRKSIDGVKARWWYLMIPMNTLQLTIQKRIESYYSWTLCVHCLGSGTK